ncbi:MAG: SUMF1/EgtB/PvdO family nonheme iron enzyme [Anaerolineales bacterium]|nr:SUMF1/EgtB/PvdO family nonheme iron enzyme [Anaerolineales bacterium]
MPEQSKAPLIQYLNFDLEISPAREDGYRLAVLDSPGGQAEAITQFPFSQNDIERYDDKLRIALLSAGVSQRLIPSSEEKAVQELGLKLLATLMRGQVQRCFARSLEIAAQQGKGLRLRLRIQPPELAALPWEYLYEPDQGEYLCLRRDTPVVRYLSLPQTIQPLEIQPPLRILGMVASPLDQEEIEIDTEQERLEQALQGLTRKGLVKLTWLESGDWRELQSALRDPWHVFHFIGHGRFNEQTDEGEIALCKEDGNTHLLGATQLARLLGNQRSLRLALLNSCEGARGGRRDIFSSTASILVRRGLPAVIAMQHKITNQAAIEFARVFYESLAEGLPVDAAVSEGRTAISIAFKRSLEWGTPVLYMRSPDGLLFQVQPGAQPAAQKEQGQAAPPKSAPRKRAAKPQEPAAAAPKPEQPQTPERKAPSVLTLASGVTMELVHVPAGPFLMGSSPEQVQRAVREMGADEKYLKDEQPQHTVELSEYWMGRYPVTNRQYQAFVQATNRTAPRHWKGGKIPAGKEQHPVVHVSWHDALAFCQWASQASGQAVRLPTEAEWEKAARGTDGRTFPWGEERPDEKRCNFGGKVGDTTPVGRYSPQGDSPYGCADMAGNVCEWVADWYDKGEYAQRAQAVPRDPQGPQRETFRGLRGGSWGSSDNDVRSANRVDYPPVITYYYDGFRCLRSG